MKIESIVSGDFRRVLTAGLRAMGAVRVPHKTSGDYIGLYNVECTFAGSRAFSCTASDVQGGSTNKFSSDVGATLIGTVLKQNVATAESAFRIKAQKISCNLVGDECEIEGVTVE